MVEGWSSLYVLILYAARRSSVFFSCLPDFQKPVIVELMNPVIIGKHILSMYGTVTVSYGCYPGHSKYLNPERRLFMAVSMDGYENFLNFQPR